MKYLIVILTFISLKVVAQTDEVDIKQTVNNLFEGMRKTDTALLRSVFSSNPVFETVIKNKEGKTIIVTEVVDSFIVSIGQPHTQIYDERIKFDVIKVDGELAIVWAPYKFYLNDTFNHCGVDSFELAKLNGIWKIIYLVDTRRRQNCE